MYPEYLKISPATLLEDYMERERTLQHPRWIQTSTCPYQDTWSGKLLDDFSSRWYHMKLQKYLTELNPQNNKREQNGGFKPLNIVVVYITIDKTKTKSLFCLLLQSHIWQFIFDTLSSTFTELLEVFWMNYFFFFLEFCSCC